MGVVRWCERVDDSTVIASTTIRRLPTPIPAPPHKGEGFSSVCRTP